MNTVLWVIQILLALAFIIAGFMKVTQPIDKLAGMMDWINTLNPRSLVRVIGALEVLGGIGVVLPALTGILPELTPIAAGGLVLTAIGAMALHAYRKDAFSKYMPSLVLGVMAAFVVYGRLVAVPLV